MIQLHNYRFCHPHSQTPSKEWTFMGTEASVLFQVPIPSHLVSSASPIVSRLRTPHRTTERVTSFLIVILVIDLDRQVPFLAAPSSRALHLTGLQHFCHQITSRYTVPWQTLSLMKTLLKGIKRWACMFYISPWSLTLGDLHNCFRIFKMHL